jgi:hypothetical protein
MGSESEGISGEGSGRVGEPAPWLIVDEVHHFERRSVVAFDGRLPRVEWRHINLGIGWPHGFHDPADDLLGYGPPIVPTVPPLASDETRCPMSPCNALPGEPHTTACIARRAGRGEDVDDEARRAGLIP